MATFKKIPIEQYEEKISHFVNSLRAYRTMKRDTIKTKDFNAYYFFFRTKISLDFETRLPFFYPIVISQLLDIDYPYTICLEQRSAYLPCIYKTDKERKYNVDIMVFDDTKFALSIYKKQISSIYGKH